MKWPSSSASAARNSAKISSSVTRVSLDFAARNRLAARAPQPLGKLGRNRRLRERNVPPIRPPIFGPAACRRAFLCNRINRGDDETDGMGDRPGGSRANTSGGGGSGACGRPAASDQRGSCCRSLRRQPRRPRPPAPSIDFAAPTPGIGVPDGRKGIQDQVTELGQDLADFHNNWLLTDVRRHQHLRAGAAGLDDRSAIAAAPTRRRRAPATTPRSRSSGRWSRC